MCCFTSNYFKEVFFKDKSVVLSADTTTLTFSNCACSVPHAVSISSSYVILNAFSISKMAFVHVQILESSRSLLCLLKEEAENLNKATEPRRKVH